MFRFPGTSKLDELLRNEETDARKSEQLTLLLKTSGQLLELLEQEVQQWLLEAKYLESIEMDDPDRNQHTFITASVRNHAASLQAKLEQLRVDLDQAGL